MNHALPKNVPYKRTATHKHNMPDYVQHVVADLPPTPPMPIVRVECEKSGTLYWENTSTGERYWSKEARDKEETDD